MELKAKDAIPQLHLEWFRADLRHANEWRKKAKLDFDYRDGDQYTEEERDALEHKEKPDAEFNFVGPIVDAISGQEISNRQEVTYLPRETSDQEATELLTSAALWARDRADADDNDSDAFRDTITAGMGWTETRLDYENNPDGDLKDDRIDPFEMVWDYNARKPNLVDATRLWRVRCLPIEEARAFVAEWSGPDGKPLQIADEDLHAAWAAQGVWDGGTDPHQSESVRNRMVGRRSATGELEEAVIVHCMWIEREDVWTVPVPELGTTEMNAEKYEAFKKGWKENFGSDLDEKALGVRKRKKKVRYQAFLGNIVLKVMPTACPDHFNFKCITGKRNQTKGQWYGIVRSAIGPQSWSNKLYSEILYIVSTSAKGGILAERGAFDNDNDAQESWARQERITWAKTGALSGANPKWAQKPVAQVPPALQYLLEVASTAIFKATGVNMELLGMREADQAGVLEYQRRQAGLTILQVYFDNLKAYRRQQGELILWYIQKNLSDGRWIRIVGDPKAPPVQLGGGEEGSEQAIRSARMASLEYDVIVADAPTSPNQKEKTWQLITQMLPIIKDMLTPDVLLALAEDSPLPTKTVQKLQKLSEQASQSPQAQLAEKMQQLEAMVLETKAQLQAAQANKANADAQKAANEQPADPNAELAIKQQESQGKLAIQAQESNAKLALQDREQQGKMALAQQEQSAAFALRQSEQAQNQQIQAANAEQDMRLKEQTFTAEQGRADKASTSDIARKDAQAKAAARRPKPAAKPSR